MRLKAFKIIAKNNKFSGKLKVQNCCKLHKRLKQRQPWKQLTLTQASTQQFLTMTISRKENLLTGNNNNSPNDSSQNGR